MSARPVKRTPARKALFLTLTAQRPVVPWRRIADRLNALPGDPITPIDLAVWRYHLRLPKRGKVADPWDGKRTDQRRDALRSRWGDGSTFDVVLAELNGLRGARLDRMDLHLWRAALGLPPIGREGAPRPTQGARRARMPTRITDPEPLPPPPRVVVWADASPDEILDWARRTRVLRPAGVSDGAYLRLINQRRMAFGLPRFRPLLGRREYAHAP